MMDMLYVPQVVFLGMGISSPLIGLLGDKHGRKVVSSLSLLLLWWWWWWWGVWQWHRLCPHLPGVKQSRTVMSMLMSVVLLLLL